MQKVLEVKNLHVQYNTDEGTVHAVNGLDVSIEKGEVRGLVGETGAGKTTLALSILRLLPEKVGQVTQGEILFDGADITSLNDKKMLDIRGKKISMIFQDPMSSLNPVLTVGDQIREVLELHAMVPPHEMDAKVDDIMRLIGIPAERKGEFPHQFSGGMKQRIVIAMALVCEPELLLADEPTTALDVTIQAQILHLMKELKDKINTSMLFITHDLGVVAQFCDTVSVIYAGEIVESGTVEQVYTRDKNHPYTEGLFNSIPYLTSNAKRLTPIEGFVVDPKNPPKYCKFYDRCPKRMDKCASCVPPQVCDGTHMIRCFLYEQETEKNHE